MKLLNKYCWLMLFIIITSSSYCQQAIKDIIPPVKVISGVNDTVLVSDLFYLPDYSLNFIQEKNINADFDKSKNQLVIRTTPDFEGFSTIDFRYQNQSYSIPIIGKKLIQHKFSFKPTKKYKSINLFGSFNNWNRQQLPMIDSDGDGFFEVNVTMDPGRYEYKFFDDGEEILDPSNKETVANDIGGINSVITIPDPHAEKFFLHKIGMIKGETNSGFKFYIDSEKKKELSPSNVIVLLDNKRIGDDEIRVDGNRITINVANSGLQKAQMLRVVISSSGLSSNMQMIPLSNGQPAGEKSSFSWYDGMIYSLMIDRFNNGDKKNDSPVKHDSLSWKANYNGGDFAGVTQKINEGYFNSLGINTIWISPVNDNTDKAFKEYPAPHRWFTGYHGYWPIDDKKVEEKFGSFDELKTLVKTAHAHGIKILLDFVSHHVHQEHPYFKNHPDWFGKLELPGGRLNLRLWDEQRLTTWFEPYMPSFDFTKSDEATEAMSSNAIWWMKKTGVDGFRHDAVKHVPNKFWRTLTRKLKKEIEIPTGRTVYQIGETFGNYDLVSSYVNNGQLSSQFNFELYNNAQAVFIDPKRSFADLNAEINKTLDVFGPLHLMGNIMDSHDKNRYMAYADGDLNLSQWSADEIGWNNPPKVDNATSYEKAELYYAYMFSIPGLPVIYYGSEFGMTGASDPDNRRMMRFGNELDANENKMLKVVSEIVKIRKKHSALRYGDYLPLVSNEKIFAFIRSDFRERVLVVLNKSEEEQKIELALPSFYNIKNAISLVDGSIMKVEKNNFPISVNARGWKILKLESK